MTVINAPKIIVCNKVLKLKAKQNSHGSFFLSQGSTISLLGTLTISGAVSSSRVRITKMLERKIPQFDSTRFHQCDRGVQDFFITTNVSTFEA